MVLTNFQHVVSFSCTSMIYKDTQSGKIHDSDTCVNLVTYLVRFCLEINIRNFQVNLVQKYTTLEPINTGKIVGVVLNKV